MAEKMAGETTPSISGSLSELAGSVAEMFQSNISMLRVEISVKAARATRAAVVLIFGLAVLAVAMLYAVFALYLLLVSQGLSPLVSAWIIACSALVVGASLALSAIRALITISPVPERTFAEFGRNIDVIKTNIRSAGDA